MIFYPLVYTFPKIRETRFFNLRVQLGVGKIDSYRSHTV